MASISFYAGDTVVNHLSGSGLGFFGGSFGQSVELNKWQDTTFITDGNGTVRGGAANNVKYSTDSLAYAAGIVPATGLKFIPNSKATCNIRFTNSTAVKTQNVKLRIFDRTNKDYAASGVVTRISELLHCLMRAFMLQCPECSSVAVKLKSSFDFLQVFLRQDWWSQCP